MLENRNFRFVRSKLRWDENIFAMDQVERMLKGAEERRSSSFSKEIRVEYASPLSCRCHAGETLLCVPPSPPPCPLSKVTPQRLKHSTPLHSTPRKSELIVSGFHSVTGRNYIAATNGDSVVYRNDFFTFRFPSGFRKRSTVNATART